MGEKRKRRPAEEDSLRWYEVLTCCCKWRAECRSCVATTCIYFVPIVFLLCLTAASIVIGVLWRTSCDYNPRVPYWVLLSSVTPYPLLVFIKAVKEKYQGITFWRATSLTYYVMFAVWMVIGSIWVYDTWGQACDDCCNHYLKTYALVLTCVHWLLLVLATVPQIYILAWVCCCLTDPATHPLKPGTALDNYPM